MMLKSRIVTIILGATLLFMSGCGGGGDSGGSPSGGSNPPVKAEVSYDLEQGTVEVDSSTVEQMSVVPEINASNYMNDLVFKAPDSSAFAGYKVGDTLMSGVSKKAPYGFLRKIIAIDRVGGELVITTTQGNLLEATNNLKIDYISANITPSDITSIQLAKGVVLENMKLDNSGQVLSVATSQGSSLFDISIDHTFTHNGGDVTVSGRTTFDFGIIFKLETEYLVIPEYFKTSLVIDQGTKISVVSSNGIDYQDDISLGTIHLAPIALSAIVIVPKINLVLKADGTIQANFALSASENFHGEIGVEYKRGRSPSWKPIHENQPETDYVLPNLESVNANIKVNAGPEFSLMVYGIVGPYMYLSGFGELDVSAATPPNLDLDLDVGVEYELGVKVDVLWIDSNYELVSDDLFRVNVLSLTNAQIPDNIYLQDPMNGEFILYGPAKTVTATYSGTAPQKVDFLIDGSLIGSDTTAPYAIEWDTNTSALGSHTLSVTSYNGSNDEIATDSSVIDLKEAKWREGGVSGISNIGYSDFLYNTGYVFGINDDNHLSVIKKSTDGGKSWSTFLSEEIGVEGLAFEKGFLDHDGSLVALELLSTNLYRVGQGGKTLLFNSFENNNSGMRDFALNNNSGIRVVLNDSNGSPYIGAISTTIEAIKLADIGTPGSVVTGHTNLTFSRESSDGIVFDIKATDIDNGTITYNYMLSNNGGNNWTWNEFTGVNLSFYDDINGAYFISSSEIVLVGTHYVDSTDYTAPVPVASVEPDSAFVLKTTDRGATWQKIEVPAAKGFHSVTFINEKEGFASVYAESDTAQPKVYKTENAGLTWTAVEEVSTKERVVRVQFSSEYSGVAVGDRGTVFRFSLN